MVYGSSGVSVIFQVRICVKNISIRNISSEASCAVTLCNGMSDLLIENVTVNGGYAAVSPFRKYVKNGNDKRESYEYAAATLKNCVIKNINLASSGAVAVIKEGVSFVD